MLFCSTNFKLKNYCFQGDSSCNSRALCSRQQHSSPFFPALHSTCALGKRFHYTNKHGIGSCTPCLANWLLCRTVPAKTLHGTRAKVPGTLPQQWCWNCLWWRWERICLRFSNHFLLDQMPLLGFKKFLFLWNLSARRVFLHGAGIYCLPQRAEFPKNATLLSRYSKAEESKWDLPHLPCRAESNTHLCACTLRGKFLFYSTCNCNLLNFV